MILIDLETICNDDLKVTDRMGLRTWLCLRNYVVSGSKNIEVREKVRTQLVAWIHVVVTSSEPVSLMALWHLYAFSAFRDTVHSFGCH